MQNEPTKPNPQYNRTTTEVPMSTTSLMTFAEFEQLPDAPGKQELIDGELVELPPPRFHHSQIAVWFFDLLRPVIGKSRVWHEAGYRIGGGWLQPDVSVLWPKQPLVDGYLSGSPMLAVEVLSPRNTPSYIKRKLAIYLSHGAGEVWVVDSKRKIMSVYRGTPDQVVRVAADSTYASDLLGLTIELSQAFE
jgi:Uma2 family endonuclease